MRTIVLLSLLTGCSIANTHPLQSTSRPTIAKCERDIDRTLHALNSNRYEKGNDPDDTLSKLLIAQLQTTCQAIRTDAIIGFSSRKALDQLFSLFEKHQSTLSWKDQVALIPELIRSYAYTHYRDSPATDTSADLSRLESRITAIEIEIQADKDACYADVTHRAHQLQQKHQRQGVKIQYSVANLCSSTDLAYAHASTLELARFFHNLLAHNQKQCVARFFETHPDTLDELFNRFVCPMLEHGARVNQHPLEVLQVQKALMDKTTYREEDYRDIKTPRNTIAPFRLAAGTRNDDKARRIWGKLLDNLSRQSRKDEAGSSHIHKSHSLKTKPPSPKKSGNTKISRRQVIAVLHDNAEERVLKSFLDGNLEMLSPGAEVRCLTQEREIVAFHTLAEMLALALHSRCESVRQEQFSVHMLKELPSSTIPELVSTIKEKFSESTVEKLAGIIRTEMPDTALQALINVLEAELTPVQQQELMQAIKNAQLDNLLALFEKCGSHMCWGEQRNLTPELIRSFALVHEQYIQQSDSNFSRLLAILRSSDPNTLKQDLDASLSDLLRIRSSSNDFPQHAYDAIKRGYATASTIALAFFYHKLLCNKQKRPVTKFIEKYPMITDTLHQHFVLPMLQQGGNASKNPYELLEQREKEGLVPLAPNDRLSFKKEDYANIPSALGSIRPLLLEAKREGTYSVAYKTWKAVMERLVRDHQPITTVASNSGNKAQGKESPRVALRAKVREKQRARRGAQRKNTPKVKYLS